MGGENAIRSAADGATVAYYLATNTVGSGQFYADNKPINF